MSEVGIDDIAIHFPKLYLDMKDFAEMRDADYGKLNKGLGLSAVSYTHLRAHETREESG